MDAPDTPLRVKKRSHSHMSPEGVSKSDMERSEPGRDRKDKKRRKKKRKISVVQEVDTQPSASARAPASKDSITLNPPTSSPEPIFESMRTSGPTLKPSSNYVVSSEPEPEFVQGSSASTIKGAKSPIVDVAAQTEETTTLKQSLEIQTQSLNSHTALLASLLPSLTCQVCLDLLHKPFALAPCGHMVCYSCLVTWFTTPPTNDNVHELPIYRKKTCPHCRAVVRNRPAEVWGVKEMVANVVKSGLAVGFPVPPADDVNRNPAARDPWANIFHALPGAVAAPGMAHPPEGDLANLGMFDAEDGVYRCLDCMHEIWEGSCAQCGRIYPGHDVGFMGSDDDEDDVAHMVNALRNGLVNGFHPVQQVLGLLGNGNGEGDNFSDDDDGGSDGSYDSSFIDDDGQDGGDARRVIDLTSEPDDDDASEVRQLGRGWRHGRPQQHSPDIIELDDEDEDEPIPPPPPRGRRARIVEDEDEDEVTHEHYASRSPSIGRDGYSSQDSERDDSDDDGAIPGPARRLAHYIREPSFDDDDASGRSDDEDDYTGEHQYRAALFSPRSAYDDDEENELSGDEYESGDGY